MSTKKLSEKEMTEIMQKGTINNYSAAERKQVFEFAFGKEYMESDDKGKLKKYRV
jgi:hypothetical protein